LKDITRLTEMLAYAFASADLLVDVNADGVIQWAGGAFRTLLNMRPQDAIGMPLSAIILPRDRDVLGKALATIASRGRLSPLLLRLANPAEARCVVSGLALGDADRRYLVTVGQPPASQVSSEVTLRAGRDFGIEAESWARNGQSGMLGLLDINGWESAAATLDEMQLGCLKHMIGRVAAEAGGEDLVVGEIGDGRFGVLGRSDTDLSRLRNALQELVGSFVADQGVRIEQAQLDLQSESLTLGQSVHALRLVLTRFGSDGVAGTASMGFAEGLTGIIERASGQKRALAAIITEGRFVLTYQSVVGLGDRVVHHYEALVRPAQTPGAALMSPQEFVTLIEAVGLANEFDMAVLRSAILKIREAGVAVAVNVSGLSIVDPSFTSRLLREAAGLPRGRLLIELTETAEIEDLAAAAAQIQRMRAAHIAVCLDDFGAGSASFRYVRDLPFDFVKIDGTYVRAAVLSEQGRSFIRAMHDLAETAGAKTIAEMIETEAQAALMLELGVSYGQGYLFGRPQPIQPKPAVARPVPPKAAPPKAASSEENRPARWKY
jgi:EAL domain-containing protein (putative c-di-GMP-specific phosphodiesterase class I)